MQQKSSDLGDSSSCPILIGGGPSSEGPRLGGRAPEGVQPAGSTMGYFFTLASPWERASEVSLFISKSMETVVLKGQNRIVRTPIVELIEHPKSVRSFRMNPWDSDLSEHSLVLQDLRSDFERIDGEVERFSGHKLGGAPYFIHGRASLVRDVRAALSEGYQQTLQLDSPGGDDASVSGDWTVGMGMFHLLAKVDGAKDWFCFWEA